MAVVRRPVHDVIDRRRAIAGIAALVAGCLGDDEPEGDPAGANSPTEPRTDSTPGTAVDETTTPSPGGGSGSPTTDADDGDETVSPTDAGDLDLREANVTAVSVGESDGEYRFDVTLYHDDDGEDGYANWWQVESLDGEQLGRRTLLHAHGTREFTRSDSFDLPDVDCVVVRGHDQAHGYGGQAMLVTLETGAARTVRQGSEPRSLADATCP